MATNGQQDSSILYQGYLRKQHSWKPGWSERYFMLTMQQLHYFKRQPTNEYWFGDRRGTISLTDAIVNDVDGEVCTFQLTSALTGKIRMLKANSKEEAMAWKQHIRASQQSLYKSMKNASTEKKVKQSDEISRYGDKTKQLRSRGSYSSSRYGDDNFPSRNSSFAREKSRHGNYGEYKGDFSEEEDYFPRRRLGSSYRRRQGSKYMDDSPMGSPENSDADFDLDVKEFKGKSQTKCTVYLQSKKHRKETEVSVNRPMFIRGIEPGDEVVVSLRSVQGCVMSIPYSDLVTKTKNMYIATTLRDDEEVEKRRKSSRVRTKEESNYKVQVEWHLVASDMKSNMKTQAFRMKNRVELLDVALPIFALMLAAWVLVCAYFRYHGIDMNATFLQGGASGGIMPNDWNVYFELRHIDWAAVWVFLTVSFEAYKDVAIYFMVSIVIMLRIVFSFTRDTMKEPIAVRLVIRNVEPILNAAAEASRAHGARQHEEEDMNDENFRVDEPHDAHFGRWCQSDSSDIRVRGPNYLNDKIKQPVGPDMFSLLHFELKKTEHKLVHIARAPEGWLTKRRNFEARRQQTSHTPDSVAFPLVFIVNFQIPGWNVVAYFSLRRPEVFAQHRGENVLPQSMDDGKLAPPPYRTPSQVKQLPRTQAQSSPENRSRFMKYVDKKRGRNGNSVDFADLSLDVSANELQPQPPILDRQITPRAYGRDDAALEAEFDSNGFYTVLDRFIKGSDEYCNARVKLIPRVVDGNWIVKKGVGTKPAILGNKLYQKIYRNVTDPKKNYVEVDIDVHSSQVGARLLALCKGWSSDLVIDLMFLLEGQAEDELPERMIGGVRIIQPNIDDSSRYPDSTIQMCRDRD